MKRCVITQSAVETIHRESLLAFQMGKETGGALMGPPPMETAVVITSATGPGPDDKCASYASWETDPSYLNEMLKKARDEFRAVNLRGFWHRHPGRMTRPSGQDLSEARKILKDKKHYKLRELIMPIVTATQEQITIQAYYISDAEPRFKEVPVEVVPDSDKMVESLVSDRKVIEIEEEAEPRFWRDQDWQFYRSAYGLERLREELNGLSVAGYEAMARLLDDGGCCVEAWRDGSHRRALFLLPREYPLNPPLVFMKRGKDIQELKTDNLSPLCRWSSVFQLAELTEIVLGERLRIRKCTDKRIARFGTLAAIKDDFRRGGCGISRLLRQLVGLIRGKGKCG